MRLRNYHSNLALLDLLMNIVLYYAMCYILTTIFVNPKVKQEKNVEAKAEAVITVTWDKENRDDVDTYVEDPAGGIVYFQDKEENLMHLDRDDLGHDNDTITIGNHTFEYKENREIVTLRGLFPGEYIVNVHMYAKRVRGPTEVTITLERLNPSLQLKAARTVTLMGVGDEETAFRFIVNKKGEITDINFLKKEIVGDRISENLDYYNDYNDDGNYNEETPP